MPTEIVIAPIAGQVVGVPCLVTGTASLTPPLQIAEDRGAYSTALPAGATVAAFPTVSFSIPHTFTTPGQHTVSVMDTSTGNVTTSNPVIVAAPVVPCPDKATINAPTTADLIDAALAVWTIVGGIALRNGVAAGYSANVVTLAWVGGVIWQANSSGKWYPWTGTTWTGNGVTSPLAPPLTTNAASGQFRVANGQIIDPAGKVFLAQGFNCGPANMADVTQHAATLLPGFNFIRLATWDTAPYTIADYQAFIAPLSAKGIVVLIEDHAYPSPGTYTGGTLNSESAWYATLATAFASNPYVWFGTMNEPNSGSYGAAEAAISVQEAATYAAIRGTGSKAMILMELYGGGNPGTIGAGFGMTPTTYATMTNVGWDLHYYGWAAGMSTDPATVMADLLGSVSSGSGILAAQTITSADGVMPVIIGEFGDSTTGATVDVDASQVINAVLTSGYGYAAWTWGGQGGPDQLTQNGTLTPFGQQVAAGIAARAAAHG